MHCEAHGWGGGGGQGEVSRQVHKWLFVYVSLCDSPAGPTGVPELRPGRSGTPGGWCPCPMGGQRGVQGQRVAWQEVSEVSVFTFGPRARPYLFSLQPVLSLFVHVTAMGSRETRP